MALSDQVTKLADELTKLAARAQEAEARAKAARDETRADLEQDLDSARASAQAQADRLRAAAEESRGNISAWWAGVQKSWDERAAQVREHVESKKAEHDVRAAQRKADTAEADATFAIDFAYAAVVEAEHAVLDAALARMEADEAAPRVGATG
jgi:hypothetical protein